MRKAHLHYAFYPDENLFPKTRGKLSPVAKTGLWMEKRMETRIRFRVIEF